MFRFLAIAILLLGNLSQPFATSLNAVPGRCALGLRTAPPDPCSLPHELNEVIARKYPTQRLVHLADLDEYDQKLFRKDHGDRCPGLVKVNFYGDKEPAFAMVLILGGNPKRKAELVVARNRANSWEPQSLETTDGTPVVWSQKPGKYEGIWDPKPIVATHSVIVFCGYESWAIVYAWTENGIVKTWISD